jgi:hypothetical protein
MNPVADCTNECPEKKRKHQSVEQSDNAIRRLIHGSLMVRGVVRDVNIFDIGDWDRCQHHTVSIGKDGRMINVERGPKTRYCDSDHTLIVVCACIASVDRYGSYLSSADFP